MSEYFFFFKSADCERRPEFQCVHTNTSIKDLNDRIIKSYRQILQSVFYWKAMVHT